MLTQFVTMDTCGFWMKTDLLGDLAKLMEAPTCGSYVSDTGSESSLHVTSNLLFDHGLTADDQLEMMRSDAHEDFLTNGVDVELDELDMYQSELRERAAADSLTIEHNPVLLEYLKMKQRRKNKKAKKVCMFCKNNGERANVYERHVLKDARGRICCPILRKYMCPLCGVSGDGGAHTIRYCPHPLPTAGLHARLN